MSETPRQPERRNEGVRIIHRVDPGRFIPKDVMDKRSAGGFLAAGAAKQAARRPR